MQQIFRNKTILNHAREVYVFCRLHGRSTKYIFIPCMCMRSTTSIDVCVCVFVCFVLSFCDDERQIGERKTATQRERERVYVEKCHRNDVKPMPAIQSSIQSFYLCSAFNLFALCCLLLLLVIAHHQGLLLNSEIVCVFTLGLWQRWEKGAEEACDSLFCSRSTFIFCCAELCHNCDSNRTESEGKRGGAHRKSVKTRVGMK